MSGVRRRKDRPRPPRRDRAAAADLLRCREGRSAGGAVPGYGMDLAIPRKYRVVSSRPGSLAQDFVLQCRM